MDATPLLLKYLKSYEQNPSSKVFAPLAETYRKLGKIEEALKILKTGIRIHPTYTLGYLVLANCYFDQNKFEFAYNTLRPLVTSNLDNTSLQKLFAQTCEKLLYLEEALETYKYLLFLSPKDEVAQEKVKLLEDKLLREQEELLIAPPSQKNSQLSNQYDEDGWKEVNLSKAKKVLLDDEENSNWELKNKITPEVKVSEEIDHTVQEVPFMTLTLVDIYLNQNLFDKAYEILEKILEINPRDERVALKLKEVRVKSEAFKLSHKEESVEEQGHKALMDLIDTKVQKKSSKNKIVEQKLNLFLLKIKEQASVRLNT
jgi:tetratricopeptide (TPR) repeat protein